MAMPPLETIDFRVRLRTPQMLEPWDPDNPAPHFKQYIDFYKMRPRLTPQTMEQFIQTMHADGVSKGVVCCGSRACGGARAERDDPGDGGRRWHPVGTNSAL